MSENDLEELRRRSAGGKVGQEQMFDEAVFIRSLRGRLSRLGRQNGSTAHHRGGHMALDP